MKLKHPRPIAFDLFGCTCHRKYRAVKQESVLLRREYTETALGWLISHIRARPTYRSAEIYRPITRLTDISYRPFSTDKLSAINKNVLFTILLINARCFGTFAHTFKHENDALERACTHTQMTTSGTFKFLKYMHINVWNKNMPNNCLRPLT